MFLITRVTFELSLFHLQFLGLVVFRENSLACPGFAKAMAKWRITRRANAGMVKQKPSPVVLIEWGKELWKYTGMKPGKLLSFLKKRVGKIS